MVSDKIIYIFDSFSEETDCPFGKLYVENVRGIEKYSFEYDNSWLLNHKNFIQLDPEIYCYAGRQYSDSSSLFGIFSDSSPDRWGRVLMMKRERLLADKEHRKPKKLLDSDFLLGVYDESRMGGLRFKLDPLGECLSNDYETATPPWAKLRTLEEASRQLENDDISLNEKWLNQLLRPGSSLGGARPKATVVDTEGSLWIAKFPSKNDCGNIGAWEKVASDLAKLCGLNVPESKLENFSKNGGTFLVKRFDREKNKRIHFSSAMTLLGKKDGDSAKNDVSYLDIASFIRSNGINVKEDLLELWKRIVFSMAVSNTDDHLRNHAFILDKEGFRLSPLYDVNPVPYGDELSLNVNEDDNRISFELAIECSNKFGISKKDAIDNVKLISNVVKYNWVKLAMSYDIGRGQIEEMRPAFRQSELY